MAHRDPAAHDAGDTRIGVDHAEVLDVGLVADRDPLGVARTTALYQTLTSFPEVDVAQDDRPRGR